jgi:hypothetical protein
MMRYVTQGRGAKRKRDVLVHRGGGKKLRNANFGHFLPPPLCNKT